MVQNPQLQLFCSLLDDVRRLFSLKFTPQEIIPSWSVLNQASKKWEFEEWLQMQLIFQRAFALSSTSITWQKYHNYSWFNQRQPCMNHDLTPAHNEYFIDKEHWVQNITWNPSFDNSLISVLRWYSSKNQTDLRKQCMIVPNLLAFELDDDLSKKTGAVLVRPLLIENVHDWKEVRRRYTLFQRKRSMMCLYHTDKSSNIFDKKKGDVNMITQSQQFMNAIINTVDCKTCCEC